MIPGVKTKIKTSRIQMNKFHIMMINHIRDTVKIITSLWVIIIMMMLYLVIRKKFLYQSIIVNTILKTKKCHMIKTLISTITVKININKPPLRQIKMTMTTQNFIANHLNTLYKTFQL